MMVIVSQFLRFIKNFNVYFFKITIDFTFTMTIIVYGDSFNYYPLQGSQGKVKQA